MHKILSHIAICQQIFPLELFISAVLNINFLAAFLNHVLIARPCQCRFAVVPYHFHFGITRDFTMSTT